MKEAPYAFGSAWESEKDRSVDDWRQAVASRVRLVAEVNGRVVGTAAYGTSDQAGIAAMTSLWVEPGSRGQGAGDRLVMAAVEWARAAGFRRVLLWVTEGNLNAEALYLRNGFSRTGETVDEPKREFEMSRNT